MTMWMDKISDHIYYNSMGNSNITVTLAFIHDNLYWKWTVLFSEPGIRAMFITYKYQGC